MELLSCKDVSLAYENNTVLCDLSFSVSDGDYLCIVGENGSGKSTLIKALLSLKQVAGGTIKVHGGKQFRRSIGYMPQQTDAQKDFPASVWEVVLSGCQSSRALRPFYSKAEKALAAQNMQRLDITALKRRSYRELSGGQQQRVLLARALCAGSRVVLLDEPVAGLDPVMTNELYRLIKQINEDGITVIMVSHDIASTVKYASHILHLQNKPLFFGTVEDYIRSDAGKRFLNEKEA